MMVEKGRESWIFFPWQISQYWVSNGFWQNLRRKKAERNDFQYITRGQIVSKVSPRLYVLVHLSSEYVLKLNLKGKVNGSIGDIYDDFFQVGLPQGENLLPFRRAYYIILYVFALFLSSKVFIRMLYLWHCETCGHLSFQKCHINEIIQYVTFGDCLFFHSASFSWDSCRLCVSTVCSFLLLSGIPWYGWTTVCLSIYLLKEGHLVCFQFGLLQIKLLWTFMYRFYIFIFSGINAQECNCWVIWQVHV